MERRKPLKSGKQMKRSPLKKVSKKQQAQRAEASMQARSEGAAFHRQIAGERCAVCARTETAARKATGLGHQAHHAIRKEVLKRLGLEEHLWDPANAVCLCEEPCHRRHTSRKRRVERAELPQRVFRFVSQLGLETELDREYPL